MRRREFMNAIVVACASLFSPRYNFSLEDEISGTRVLAVSTMDEKGNPMIKAYTVDFNQGQATEVWQTQGTEPGFINHLDNLVIADVDNDGINELLAVDRHRLLLWKPPHQQPITAELGYKDKGFATVEVGDANQDGYPEIFVGAGSKMSVFEYRKGKIAAVCEPLEQPYVKFL